jgi:hypothetical protein
LIVSDLKDQDGSSRETPQNGFEKRPHFPVGPGEMTLKSREENLTGPDSIEPVRY